MRIKKVILSLMLLAIITGLSLAGSVFAQREKKMNAEVIFTDGFVEIMRAGSVEWEALTEGTYVGVGDMVETGDEGEVELLLPDGSRLKVGPDSNIVVKEMGMVEVTEATTSRFELIKGKIRAIVTPFAHRDSRFTIETENATVGVRGTDFGEAFDPDMIETYVVGFDSCISLTSSEFADLPPIDVCAGEELTATGGVMPGDATEADEEKVQEFMDNMGFEGEVGIEVPGFTDEDIEPPYITQVLINNTINLEDVDETLTLTTDDLNFNGNVSLIGNAEDENYTIERVEVTIDGGMTWEVATGGESWYFDYTPEEDVEYEVMVKAINDKGVESDPYELGPWYVVYLNVDYEDIARDFLDKLKDYIENSDLTGLEELVSDDFDGSAGKIYSKDEFVDSIEKSFESGADISINFSISQITHGSIIIATNWTSTVGSSHREGTTKFWLSEEDNFRLAHTEGDWFLGVYYDLPAKIEMREYTSGSPPCDNKVEILLTVPDVPMSVEEVTIELEAETCGVINRTLTRSYYASETGMDIGFGAEFVTEKVMLCTDPHLCGSESIMYIMTNPNLTAKYRDYGYDLVETIPLP